MSNQEKHHTSQRTSMLHLRYLASFMDEIDREVVSLTDRAFKSLCIGDEAIYNDSEFSASPVKCHKPRVEGVSKNTQQSSRSTFKNLYSYPFNGENFVPGRSKQNSSKDTSHFAALSAKMNGECTKMTNGDSWDKSAFLSIQRELSEFNSDYHGLTVEHLSSAKNVLHSDEKGPAKKSSKDALKCKNNKNSKLKKLNYINFFLHSEFSPFLSWRDLKTFSIGNDHISEIMLSNRQSEWYDSPLYRELTAAHEHYKLDVTLSEDKDIEKCAKQIETHQVTLQPEFVESTSPSIQPKPKKETDCIQQDIVHEAPLLATEQRCNSENVEPRVPWRKNKSRAKSAIPVGPSLNPLPVYKRLNEEEGDAQPIEKEVKTIEDQTSSSSTPFSISQLLTPVIPSRHGTGTSELLQAVLPPTPLDTPLFPEREMHPSPEIKREGYKSIASSLLFNLKDNRKRVKAMYSPSKFKGVNVTGPSKESPLPVVSGLKNELEIPEVSKATTLSPACQKTVVSPMSPLLESVDNQNSSPIGCANGGVPDDYLALSLLQSGGSAKKLNKSPLVNKAAYPSLQLYRKTSSEGSTSRTNHQNVVSNSSEGFTDKAIKPHHIKDSETSSNPRKSFQGGNKELQDNTHNFSLNIEKVCENKSQPKSPQASSTKSVEQIICEGTHPNIDKMETSRAVSMLKSHVKEKEPNRKDDRGKHLFSARQNNFIKSQRFISNDNACDDDDDGSNGDNLPLAKKEGMHLLTRHSENVKLKELGPETSNPGLNQDKGLIGAQLLKEYSNATEETTSKPSSFRSISNIETQSEPLSMKGNTSAKKALFASMEQGENKTTISFKRDNIVMDKYDLAKMALEEVIADREQRKLKSKVISNEKSLFIDINEVGCGPKLSTNGEDQQASMFRSKSGTNTNDAFKMDKQAVQMMSEDVVVKAGPIKESNSEKINKGDKYLKLQEKDLMVKYKGHAKVGTKKGAHLDNRDINREEELCIEKKGSSHTPEVPPRRGRSNSESNCRVVEKMMRNKDLRNECNMSVKTEDMESREISKIRRSQSKNRGPVKGNVSALKEKYDKESKVQSKDVQKCQVVESTSSEKSKEEMLNDQPTKDKMKQKAIIPKLTVSCPAYEIYSKEKDTENKTKPKSPLEALDRRKEECILQREHDTHDFHRPSSDLTSNQQENQECRVNGSEIKEESSEKLKGSENNHNKSNGPCKTYVTDFINGLLGLSGSENVETVDEYDQDLSKDDFLFEAFRDKSGKDSVTVHDILESSPSFMLLNGKQAHHSGLPHKSMSESQSELVSSNAEEDFSNLEMDSSTDIIHECKSDVSDRVVSPPAEVEKVGWVKCLIESARNLTQKSHSTSPKDLPEMTQPFSQRGSRVTEFKNMEDLKCFKDFVPSEVALPAIPGTSPQLNQPAMHLLCPPATQHTPVKDGKGSVESVSMCEEEERRSAVSTLSEGMDSFEATGGELTEEQCSSALTDVEGSKAPSERSGSVCSGNDSHGQNKPPAIPPKTEKAMRRAMKLTTRRIQKAEAKSKPERKGRNIGKGINHKVERRHQSIDKMEGDRSEPRSISGDSKHNEDYLEGTLEAKTQRYEKHSRRHSGHKSQNMELSDSFKNAQEIQPNHVVDSKSRSAEKKHQKLNHIDLFEKIHKDNDIDRISRNNEKFVPKKHERRTQSLDRFSRDNHENLSNNFKTQEAEVHSKLPKRQLHLSTSNAMPLRQSSFENTYAPTGNIVPQSFPITQRKLLQDPDSGQYFLVDMPVQVQTKTFFDPETKSYVQLPVKSPEGGVRQAPPMEVMNTPPLVLYHGFVPVPVSSLPSQKSIVRTTGSMITPDDLEDFETGKKHMQEDFYKMQEAHPYIEPAYVSQERTPEEEIDSVR